MEKSLIEQTEFAEVALKILNPTLEKFGFNLYKTDIEDYFTNIIWLKQNRFVRLQSTNYPTDYPYYFTIKFGEHFSEDYINSISVPLWRFVKYVTSVSEEYKFPYGNEITISILKAKEDLEKYGISFLIGNLDLYYQLLSEQNTTGEP